MAYVKDRAERDFRITAGRARTELTDFNKMRIGGKVFRDDVTMDPDWNKLKLHSSRFDRKTVDRAIQSQDVDALREISLHWFSSSGIYSRLCRYMAYFYRYDWFITPVVYDAKGDQDSDKIVSTWYKAAQFLEASDLKQIFGEIALKVVVRGSYYGYRIMQKNASYIQELPSAYCRSRYKVNGHPVVEFNIKYFNDCFSDVDYRVRVLKMFPKVFQRAYVAYMEGTLVRDFSGDETGWFPLDVENSVRFVLSDSEIPLFSSVIPKLMDLADAQELDRKKMAQQILKIIIQQMPIDKNGDLIFDVAESRAMHDNAVQMLSDAIGVDVLTTFADVSVEDMSDKGNVSSVDQLDKVERTVYNEAGSSQLQFNATGNIALNYSILNDESTMLDLLLQFESYAQGLLVQFNKNKKRQYKVQMLPTTVYNYKDLASAYKEQTMLGFSKLLPQVALGLNQTTVIATARFENQMMDLGSLFVAPQMSSTMSSKGESGSQGGRPELPDSEKSDKTLLNISSQ